jgi:hypothetical protein
MAPDTVWEIVFLMLILKIPIVYLCCVIYYAIKAEPLPEAGAQVESDLGTDDGSGPRRSVFRSRFPRPHGGPARRYPRTPHPSLARAKGEER